MDILPTTTINTNSSNALGGTSTTSTSSTESISSQWTQWVTTTGIKALATVSTLAAQQQPSTSNNLGYSGISTSDSTTQGTTSSTTSSTASSVLSSLGNRQSFVNKVRRELSKMIDPREYSRPPSDQIMARISNNAKYFKITYSLVFLIVMTLVVLASPIVFLALGLIGGMWYALFIARNPDEVFNIRGHEIGRREKLTALIPATLLIVTFGGLISTLIYILFLGSAVCGTHAALRNKIEVDPLDELEMEGESKELGGSLPPV